MIVKWIECQVEEDQKTKFSEAQEKWAKTKNVPGFIAQTGGWDSIYPEKAYIIAFWEDEESLREFMLNDHDNLYDETNQAGTYEKLTINYFTSQTELHGDADSLLDAIEHSFFLRAVNCIVRSNGTKHFENVQKSVWLPGFKKADGMQGGLFSKSQGEQNHYHLSAFWDYPESNNKFEKSELLSLRKIAAVNEDILSLDVALVDIEESWKVIP